MSLALAAMRCGPACPGRSLAGLALIACLPAADALAYGPAGHLIAGRAAEPLLCPRAAAEVARLGGGEDLGELGLWADRIRSNEAYAHAAPWHYVNVPDGASIADHVTPPEGDILWAIRHFRERLGDEGLDDRERGEALRFLVHFVVDLHQPLHAGRAEDRGGNAVEIFYEGERINLHGFWDTQVVERGRRNIGQAGTSDAAHLSRVRNAETARTIDSDSVLDHAIWAAESLAYRSTVYSFGAAGRELSAEYVDEAADLTMIRLELAAARLAATLNSIFCS